VQRSARSIHRAAGYLFAFDLQFQSESSAVIGPWAFFGLGRWGHNRCSIFHIFAGSDAGIAFSSFDVFLGNSRLSIVFHVEVFPKSNAPSSVRIGSEKNRLFQDLHDENLILRGCSVSDRSRLGRFRQC